MPTMCTLGAGDLCSIKCNFDHEQDMVLEIINVLDMYSIGYSHLTQKELREVAEEMFCNHKFWPGDHLEAASPVESSFWPIHPTLDRLLQFKEMAQPFTDKSWDGDDDGKLCTYDLTGCKGHNAGDLTFFKVGMGYVRPDPT